MSARPTMLPPVATLLRRVVYVAHAYGNNPAANTAHVQCLARSLVVAGVVPLAPQLYLPQFLNEQRERELALECCLRLVSLADEVRVYGDLTAGVEREISHAQRLGIPVVRVEDWDG